MNISFASAAALLAAALPATAAAQVANGNFDRGSSDWIWRDATYSMEAGKSCSNAAYSEASGKSRKTPSTGVAPASGRIGVVTPLKPYGVGTWGMCRTMEQTVYVPHGASLHFLLRIGDRLDGGFNAPMTHGAGFAVLVTHGATTSVLLTRTGQSRWCDGWQVPCPVFTNQSIDLAPYWGKTVRLTFRGATSGQNTLSSQVYGEPSHIYVDNIRIQ